MKNMFKKFTIGITILSVLACTGTKLDKNHGFKGAKLGTSEALVNAPVPESDCYKILFGKTRWHCKGVKVGKFEYESYYLDEWGNGQLSSILVTGSDRESCDGLKDTLKDAYGVYIIAADNPNVIIWNGVTTRAEFEAHFERGRYCTLAFMLQHDAKKYIVEKKRKKQEAVNDL